MIGEMMVGALIITVVFGPAALVSYLLYAPPRDKPRDVGPRWVSRVGEGGGWKREEKE